ncbi:MAG TPA: hypothetical protein VGU70_18670 [Methylobacterium sp.]|jgi:hypothetical protein|nr:hypothetical protein [Methylobacterium sp.]
MNAIEHILVLSQSRFVERQVDFVIHDHAEPAPWRRRISGWFRRLGAL